MLSHPVSLMRYGLLIIILFTDNVQAMWVAGTTDELVASSTVVVRATLIGQTTVESLSSTDDSKPINIGVLQVREVLKGSVAKIFLLRLPVKGLLRRSDQISYPSGQSGLWFLRPDKNYHGIYRADQPQRFLPLKESEAIPAQLQKLFIK
jgi:hypothetical protein